MAISRSKCTPWNWPFTYLPHIFLKESGSEESLGAGGSTSALFSQAIRIESRLTFPTQNKIPANNQTLLISKQCTYWHPSKPQCLESYFFHSHTFLWQKEVLLATFFSSLAFADVQHSCRWMPLPSARESVTYQGLWTGMTRAHAACRRVLFDLQWF
jgi:hypothetical protein